MTLGQEDLFYVFFIDINILYSLFHMLIYISRRIEAKIQPVILRKNKSRM